MLVPVQDTTVLLNATFARRLREVRRQAGMTQQRLADLMARAGSKIHRSTIGKIEIGDQPVTIGQAVQIAGILGVPLAELITEHAERKQQALLDAQLAVASLRREADDRRRRIEELEVLHKQAVQRLSEAEKRLHHLAKGNPDGTQDQ